MDYICAILVHLNVCIHPKITMCGVSNNKKINLRYSQMTLSLASIVQIILSHVDHGMKGTIKLYVGGLNKF
jgi:hypothetical protein